MKCLTYLIIVTMVMVVLLCLSDGVYATQISAYNGAVKSLNVTTTAPPSAQATTGGVNGNSKGKVVKGTGQYKVSAKLNKLLDKVEKASVKLKSFEANMTYKQIQPLIETMVKRNGRLYYQVKGNTVQARIHFADFLQQDMDDEEPARPVKFDEDYVFDGMWVTRINARTKTIQKWQVARKKSNRNAFRLGKGPFPLPFALKKADMIKEFAITQMRADPNDPDNSLHLMLKPRPKSSYAKDYVQLDLWLSKKLFVPVQIRFEKGGDNCEINTVSWDDIKIDKKISPKIFTVPQPPRGWSVEETPLNNEQSK